MSNLKNKIAKLPDAPGVYWFINAQNKIIYIGKAKSLRKRVKSYFAKNVDSKKTENLVKNIANIKYKKLKTELEALIWESKLIKKYQPYYNIDLKDDKTFPYLKLTINEKWPKLIIVRRIKQDEAKYYGPFRSSTAKQILRLVKKIFVLRWCKPSPLKIRQQSCLNYHIKRCPAPCIGKIGNKDYRKLVKSIERFLQGNAEKSRDLLNNQMKNAAKNQNFEVAANIRNKIFELERFIDESDKISEFQSIDRRGDLEELKLILSLKSIPWRIEAYDISNLNATERVGSLVVFEDGLPKKNDYRKFKIREKDKKDDTSAIYEVLNRRFTGMLAKKEKDPDLILIDGGKPQVNIARMALGQINKTISVISLAKREEEICFPSQSKTLKLPRHSPALKLLQQIRDEAHRFAIQYHRFRRKKAFFEL